MSAVFLHLPGRRVGGDAEVSGLPLWGARLVWRVADSFEVAGECERVGEPAPSTGFDLRLLSFSLMLPNMLRDGLWRRAGWCC
jgi:hypothetical protein